MKNLSKTLFSFFLIVILASCSSQSTVVDNKTSKLLNTENFTFIAEEANYDGYNYTLEDISRKENSWENLPNFRERKVFVRSKSTPLDEEYSVAVTNNKLEIFLALKYAPSVATEKNNIITTIAISIIKS